MPNINVGLNKRAVERKLPSAVLRRTLDHLSAEQRDVIIPSYLSGVHIAVAACLSIRVFLL